MARTIIVICEGAGDRKFLEELISRSGFDENVQVVECEGKTKFERKLVALKAGSGFDPAAIVMVRDGDTEPEAEIKAARAEFRVIGYELTADPPDTCVAPDGVVLGLFLLPDGSGPGALEHLLFGAAAELHPRLTECVAEFERCAAIQHWSENDRAKMRFQCLVASCLESNPGASITYIWNKETTVVPVESSRFDGLRAFLGSVVAAVRALESRENGV